MSGFVKRLYAPCRSGFSERRKPPLHFPPVRPAGQIIQRHAEVVRNAHEIFKSRQIDPGLKPLVLPVRHTDGVGHLSLGLLPLFAEFPHSLLQCHIVTF